jgi:hypothetical protein
MFSCRLLVTSVFAWLSGVRVSSADGTTPEKPQEMFIERRSPLTTQD